MRIYEFTKIKKNFTHKKLNKMYINNLKKQKVLNICAISTICFWRKPFPRNFYLGKADYIFTLTFAAEVCLKVAILQILERVWFYWGGFYYVGFVGLLGWSLLREVMCVSRPVDTPNTHPCCTCYTPSLATNIWPTIYTPFLATNIWPTIWIFYFQYMPK